MFCSHFWGAKSNFTRLVIMAVIIIIIMNVKNHLFYIEYIDIFGNHDKYFQDSLKNRIIIRTAFEIEFE